MTSAQLGALLLGAVTTLASARAVGADPSIARFPANAAQSPASRYGKLTQKGCHAELDRRKIGWRPADPAPGVRGPVRLTGKLGGVTWRTDYPDAARRNTPYEIFDCRLVLGMHDFSAVLRAHGVDEVRIFSGWRPPARSWPHGKIGRRHPGGLAVDVRSMKKATGKSLAVLDHWAGRIGAETCGADAAAPASDAAETRELRSIVCEAADLRMFNSILSPNYDAAHANHLHLEVAPGVKWFIVR